MNNEEKKAIETLDYELTYSWVHNQGISKETLKLFKDIIEKQQKEIEELKEELLTENDIGYKHAIADFYKFYISKDKIREKIEPKLKELDKQINEEWKKYGNSKELQDMEDMYNFLQELLEEE